MGKIMAPVVIVVPVVQGLISACWSDSTETVLAVPARAPGSRCHFEGGKKALCILIQYVAIDLNSCSVTAICQIHVR